MNKPSIQTETENQLPATVAIAVIVVGAIAVIVFGIYQIQTSDPYIESVLATEGDPMRGHAIFQMNCAGCHGWRKDGRVGPSLEGVSERKSDKEIIHQVISGETPPMPQFQPKPQDMADLLSYLKKQ